MELRIFGADHGHFRETAPGDLDVEGERRMPRSPWEMAGSPGAAPGFPKSHVDQRPATVNGGFGYMVETSVAQSLPAAQLPRIVGGTSMNEHEGVGTPLLADA